MAVPPEFIDEVVSRTDIVSLVGNYVELKQKGKDHWGCCPFHLEKTPSFSVSTQRNMYKCFGCGKGGGAINFLMEIENLQFLEAVEKLAGQVGMQMPEFRPGDGLARALRNKIYHINKKAARFFYDMLNAPLGGEARFYLQERGLSRQTLIRFGIGFAPDSWDGLLEGMKQQGIDSEDLLEAGLVIRNDKGRTYDRFRNRIMFPIINVKGDVIGFGGRVMDDSMPKYLNSPDTPVFDKSRNLYGLVLAKTTKMGMGLLTEGYMDTIALHQAGFDGAVASLGTSFTDGHAMLLSRYFKQAVLCYDSDGAGVNATQRAIPILEKAGLAVRVLQMNGAKDPDEFIKKFGREAFVNLLEQSEHHLEYRIEQLKKKYNVEDMSQKVTCLQELAHFLATVESPVEREIYSRKVADELGVSMDSVLMEVSKEMERRFSREKKNQQREQFSRNQKVQMGVMPQQYQSLSRGKAEEGILRVLQLEPRYLEKTKELKGTDFSVEVLGRLFEVMKARYFQGFSVELPVLGESFRPEEMNYLVEIVSQPQDFGTLDVAIDDYLHILEEELEKAFLQNIEGSRDEILLAMKEKFKED